MTNAEALTLMMARLGGRTSPTLRATLVLELNNKIRELERANPKPWFLEDRADGSVVPNQDYFNLPSDFLMEVEEAKLLIWNGASWNDPQKVYMRDIQENTSDVEPGYPVGYTLFGNRVYLGPAPDLAYGYRLPYYKKSIEVVDNAAAITNSWLIEFFNYITLETTFLMASIHTQSAELATKTAPLLTRAQREFMAEVEGRMHTNQRYLMSNEES